MRYEVVFAGSGGQGLILSGTIFGEAASIKDKMHCVQAQTYGPEARGGISESYVIISKDEPVDFPELTFADVVVALSQDGLNRQKHHLKPETILIVDESFVKTDHLDHGIVHKIPMTDISNKIMGRPISANIVALGALTAITAKVSRSSIEEIIRLKVPKGTEQKNLDAFNAGFDAAHNK